MISTHSTSDVSERLNRLIRFTIALLHTKKVSGTEFFNQPNSDKLVKEAAVALFTANSGELSPHNLKFMQKAFTSKKNQHETDRHINR